MESFTNLMFQEQLIKESFMKWNTNILNGKLLNRLLKCDFMVISILFSTIFHLCSIRVLGTLFYEPTITCFLNVLEIFNLELTES